MASEKESPPLGDGEDPGLLCSAASSPEDKPARPNASTSESGAIERYGDWVVIARDLRGAS
jgi:hypothetical protein